MSAREILNVLVAVAAEVSNLLAVDIDDVISAADRRRFFHKLHDQKCTLPSNSMLNLKIGRSC